MSRHTLYLIAAMATLTGCHGGDAVEAPDPDIVAVIGRNAITRTEVSSAVPSGVSADDSLTLARAYVRQWIDNRLLYEVAATEIDTSGIEAMVNDYRRELITSRYRRQMSQRGDNAEFSPDSLHAYYQAHASDFTLERPLVKGIYLKVSDDAPGLTALKRLYKSTRPVDMDRLENEAPASAIHYDDFRNHWVDWEQIENRIPAELPTPGAGATLRPVEVSVGGFTYLLNIRECICAGEPMPYETAVPLIRERLLTQQRRALDARLRHDLYTRALERGTLVFPNGEP